MSRVELPTRPSDNPATVQAASGAVHPIAPRVARALAILIDLAIVVALALLVASCIPTLPGGATPLILLATKALSAGILGGLSGRGRSPGQLIARVETRRRDTGTHIGWWRGTVRYLAYPLLFVLERSGAARTQLRNEVVTRRRA